MVRWENVRAGTILLSSTVMDKIGKIRKVTLAAQHI